MSDVTPNDRQQDLIEHTDGMYLVDAGPGTGKTFTISRRYVEIIGQPDVEPEDVLLVTFTRSAATEMTERIVDRSEDYETHELADAPIQTFHSHCYDILQEHGYAVPTHLGIDDRITNSTRIIEEELVEQELFREFVGQFRDDHPEHADVFRALSEPTELLDVINQLAAKGVFPTEAGWYRDGEAHLDGDFEAFKERFDAVNRPRNDGRKQSDLREKLSRFGKSKTHLPDAPSRSRIRGSGTKQVPDDVAEMAFHEDRGPLKAFVHDVYYEYLRFALRRNYLNFGFLQLFAFVLLCENDALRDSLAFEYVMIDEFQDSSEIQFKLALLLADANNLCVVGDWKQSIYSFQYAAVENIQHFEDRLERFIADLNRDRERVQFDTGAVDRIRLTQNYRSTDSLIRFSEHALVTPATDNEAVDDGILDDVVTLESNAAFDNSTIEAVAHEDEHEAVLAKIQAIVGNEEYAVEDEDGDPRNPTPGDIAVLTRTRDFGRELLSVAEDHAVPLSYDGGVELFRTDPAKCLLAWLRVLEYDADRGWAVVLERAGYTLDEIDHLLETEAYPSNLVGFREELAALESVGTVARRVFDRYGMQSEYADVILHQIQSLHDTTTLTRGHLLRYIERGIENGSTHDVHTSAGDDSVTVQTIHSVKGLEYPIVILANMNEGKFPPRTRNSGVIQYQEPVGLRARKVYSEVGAFPHVYDNWHSDVYRHCLGNDYDEERRLLYVAITRAESHVCFVGGEDPNTFLEALPPDVTEAETAVGPPEAPPTAQTQLPFAVSPPEGPTGYSPHSLMDESVFDDSGELADPEGRGTDFGSEVHDFAEAYATDTDATPSNADERRIQAFLDRRDGEFIVEDNAILPLTIDGDRVAISGIVDLVHVRPEHVEIIDYKTDRSRRAHDEYRKQVSVYYHVLEAQYPDRELSASLFYTHDGEQVTIEPISMDELERIVRELGGE
ncbi:MAG: ATP-dependent helicase/nuclease subunit A [Natrialbaceae archaeon]|jgi:ATP-dependent helicase/nuclease subunit A